VRPPWELDDDERPAPGLENTVMVPIPGVVMYCDGLGLVPPEGLVASGTVYLLLLSAGWKLKPERTSPGL
jgi:hypothetical protein